MTTRTILVLSAALLLTGCQNATRDTANTTVSGAPAARTIGADSAFLREVTLANKTEVQLSEIALRQSNNPDVRRFAQMMLNDHTKAQNEVMKMAQSAGVSLPDRLDAEHQKKLDKLTGLSGDAFDREFARIMVEDHQKVVAKFEDHARSGRDPQVKSWAARTLPDLRQHLQHAKDLQSKLGSSPRANP
jgi:putative membrane protein